MGLDQNAYAVRQGVKKIELCSWRKHPNLEGWMAHRYFASGGDGSFNCKRLYLNDSDLDDLEEVLVNDELPETEGCFFGTSMGDSDERAYDLEFVGKARYYLGQGYKVYYTSWW